MAKLCHRHDCRSKTSGNFSKHYVFMYNTSSLEAGLCKIPNLQHADQQPSPITSISEENNGPDSIASSKHVVVNFCVCIFIQKALIRKKRQEQDRLILLDCTPCAIKKKKKKNFAILMYYLCLI